MTKFQINKHLYAECEYYETRYSWGHKGYLYRDNREIGYKKITYYNRTWESYQFQSLLRELADNKDLSKRETNLFKKKIENNWKESDHKKVQKEFNMIAGIAMMGEIFGSSQKESNDWKTRMLKAGLESKGLIMPDDWNELSEDEKQTRLDNVINSLKE